MSVRDLQFRWQKHTKVRFFGNFASLQKAVEASGGVAVCDPGAKFRPKTISSRDLPPGESCKQWSQLEDLLEWMASRNMDRSQTLVAIGGGACLDLSAFAASLYRRGTPLILVPTTLLAMVDATLGGKTAVDRNSTAGKSKNFAGTFYPADEVWICPEFLSSLPEKERWSGAGEVMKTLWIQGSKASAALESFLQSGKVNKDFSKLLASCLETKRKIVQKDPLDQKGIREVLNFGHTIGHALETLAKGKISHGEAVWWGMAVEPMLLGKSGEKMSLIALQYLQKLRSDLPKEFFLSEEKWSQQFSSDKKRDKQKIKMSVLWAPGKVRRIQVKNEDLLKALKDFPAFFQRAGKGLSK